MATVVDLLRQLAHDVAPHDDVLRGPLTLPPRQVSPFALELHDRLGAHWVGAFGRPTTAQHALALAATRAGEAVAFVGGDTLPSEDLLLLVLAQLRGAHTTALWLVPDRVTAQGVAKVMRQVDGRTTLRWLLLEDAPARPPFAQLIVATYDELHARLLPFADRAWRWFWRDLRTIAMSNLERANGLQGAHLRWLLRRAIRLSPHQPLLVGASGPLAEGGVAFQSLWGRACRVVDSTVGPTEAILVMLWRCQDRYATLDQLAKHLRGRGLSIAVVGRNERDDQILRARFDAQGVAAMDGEARAAIALVSGVPADPGSREALLRRGYRLVLMLAGDDPHEIFYADDIEQLITHPPALLAASGNPFVANYHLQCAAAEFPLDPAEIERWDVADRVEVLVNKQRLRMLNDGALQPSDAAVDPGTTLRVATSNARFVDVRDPLGVVIASLPPAVADWRGLPGSTWAGDLVVAHRADDPPVVDLAVDERRRLARAVAIYRIMPRTKLETRATRLADQTVTTTHWNAEIRQQVEGLEEHTVERPLATPRIAAPLEARWVAHGCAIHLSSAPPTPNGAGWSVKEALLIRTYCASEDVVVTYDADSQSLWLIETALGGSGIAQWIMEHVEELLMLARAIVRGCEANDLFRTLALRERAWLEPLLDPVPEQTPVQPSIPMTPTPEQRSVASLMPVREQESVEPAQSIATPVQAGPPARSRVYAASKKVAQLASSMEQPVIEEPAQPERAMSAPHLYEETGNYDVSVGAQSVVEETEEHEVSLGAQSVAEGNEIQDVSLASHSVVEEFAPVEATEVVEEAHFPTNDESPGAILSDGGNSRIYNAVSTRTRSDVWANETNTVEATWRLDEPEQGPEVDDVRWDANAPTHDIEDVVWEANTAAQLPLDDQDRDIPPLGRESPALSAPRQPRHERERKPVPPRRTEDRTTQAPSKIPANERGIPRRTGNESPRPERPARPAPSQPSQQRRLDNRRQDEQRNQPNPVQRTTPTRPERPPSFGDAVPGRTARSANNDRTGKPPDRTPAPPVPKEAEESVNVGSLIARMRRLREERESTQTKGVAGAPIRQPAEDVPLRFRRGQYIRCVPYGEGVVQSSRAQDGREHVLVTFPDIGTLEVDSEINFVRVIEPPTASSSEDED